MYKQSFFSHLFLHPSPGPSPLGVPRVCYGLLTHVSCIRCRFCNSYDRVVLPASAALNISLSCSGAARSAEIKAFRNNEVKVSAYFRISPLVRREEQSPGDEDNVAAERRRIKLAVARAGEAGTFFRPEPPSALSVLCTNRQWPRSLNTG